eukprot:1898477-Rhodomonas_salina.1
MEAVREYPPQGSSSRAAKGGSRGHMLVFTHTAADTPAQLEVSSTRGSERTGRRTTDDDWVEEDVGALAGVDHVMLESDEALQRLEERGFEPDAHDGVVLRGPGGCRLRVTSGRGGASGAGGAWVVLAVADVRAAVRFWSGLLGMREQKARGDGRGQ